MFNWLKKEVELFEYDFGVVFTVSDGDDKLRITITYTDKDYIVGTFGKIEANPECHQTRIMKTAATEGIEINSKWFLPHSIISMERGKVEKKKIGTGYV